MPIPISRSPILVSSFLLVAIGVLLFSVLAGMVGAVAEDTCPTNCADGFYDDPGWEQLFAGARADMESANPQLPAGEWSIMRVAVAHDALQNPNGDGSFVEMGWSKHPERFGVESRFVYGSWSTVSGVYSDLIFHQLNDGDIASHRYQVSIKPKGQKRWIFWFDGAKKGNTKQGNLNVEYNRAAMVGCGGETKDSQNAIGIAACFNVSYWSNGLVSWQQVPNHLNRVSNGYWVTDLGASSWQVGGHN